VKQGWWERNSTGTSNLDSRKNSTDHYRNCAKQAHDKIWGGGGENSTLKVNICSLNYCVKSNI
jgi:hypothetical protein